MDMTEKNLTIIGATGNLGVPVVKNLLNFGYKVKLIVRNLDKAKKIFGSLNNVTYVKAELTDVDSLKAALSGTEYLYLNLSTQSIDINMPFATEREGVANILLAVDKNTIKQILAISGLGAFHDVHNPNDIEFVPNTIRKQGHRLIKDSGIPYTILHCTWFADSFVIYRRKNTYAVIGDTENPIFFTDCYNYSKHLSNAIGNKNALFKEFPIQGKTGIKHPDAARQFLQKYSPKTKVTKLPNGLISLLSLFSKKMKFVKQMSTYFSKSKEEFLADDCETYKILGEPAISIFEYAEKIKKESVYNYL